jgi:hypothetical protein
LLKIASKAKLSETTKCHAIKMMRNIIGQEKSTGKDTMEFAATVLY